MRTTDIIIFGALAMLFAGCTSLTYDRTTTTYADRIVENTKIRRDSIWQDISFAISTNGTIEYRNDGGGKATKALLDAASKLQR